MNTNLVELVDPENFVANSVCMKCGKEIIVNVKFRSSERVQVSNHNIYNVVKSNSLVVDSETEDLSIMPSVKLIRHNCQYSDIITHNQTKNKNRIIIIEKLVKEKRLINWNELFNKNQEEIARPKEVFCPLCKAPADSPCFDMRKGYQGRLNKFCHTERVNAGLCALGLVKVKFGRKKDESWSAVYLKKENDDLDGLIEYYEFYMGQINE